MPLDDAAAAKLLRAVQAQLRLPVRVTVEVLLRNRPRVGELVALRSDAIVLIGAGHWLQRPRGKLHDAPAPTPRRPIEGHRTRRVQPGNPGGCPGKR